MEIRNLKYWFRGKWHQLMVLLGLHLSDDWILMRAIHEKYGRDIAEELVTRTVVLGLDYGRSYHSIKAIREATEPKRNA
jgi:hypothetical protein